MLKALVTGSPHEPDGRYRRSENVERQFQIKLKFNLLDNFYCYNDNK